MSVDATSLTHPSLGRRPDVLDGGLGARARRAAGDALAHAGADAGDHLRARAALAAAVELVEAGSSARSGATTREAAVVLQRRLGRALRRLDQLERLEKRAAGGHGGDLTVADLLLAAERLTDAARSTSASGASGTGR